MSIELLQSQILGRGITSYDLSVYTGIAYSPAKEHANRMEYRELFTNPEIWKRTLQIFSDEIPKNIRALDHLCWLADYERGLPEAQSSALLMLLGTLPPPETLMNGVKSAIVQTPVRLDYAMVSDLGTRVVTFVQDEAGFYADEHIDTEAQERAIIRLLLLIYRSGNLKIYWQLSDLARNNRSTYEALRRLYELDPEGKRTIPDYLKNVIHIILQRPTDEDLNHLRQQSELRGHTPDDNMFARTTMSITTGPLRRPLESSEVRVEQFGSLPWRHPWASDEVRLVEKFVSRNGSRRRKF